MLGVPDGLLRAQRQAVAAVAAPGNGTGGQNIDFALMLADEGAKGRADPAYDAHLLPIGEWSQARWENWATEKAMNRMVADAKDRLRVARNKWAVVYGPGAAYIMSCTRLRWTVIDAAHVVTDDGVLLDLNRDPPAVVKNQCV